MPYPICVWPYAAKAIVQHDHTAPNLTLYVTFRFPMEGAPGLPLALFTAYLDNVANNLFGLMWIDAYTLKLRIFPIADPPATVELSYNGPSQLLRTTWHKQWEPWTKILSLDITT